eukprot:scaffold13253_cov140-Isochrysis_galbana.AAC.1
MVQMQRLACEMHAQRGGSNCVLHWAAMAHDSAPDALASVVMSPPTTLNGRGARAPPRSAVGARQGRSPFCNENAECQSPALTSNIEEVCELRYWRRLGVGKDLVYWLGERKRQSGLKVAPQRGRAHLYLGERASGRMRRDTLLSPGRLALPPFPPPPFTISPGARPIIS